MKIINVLAAADSKSWLIRMNHVNRTAPGCNEVDRELEVA